MIAFVAGMSLLNLVLGFVLAAWLHDLLHVTVTLRERPTPSPAAAAPAEEQEMPVVEAPPAAAEVEVAPPDAPAEVEEPLADSPEVVSAGKTVVRIAKPSSLEDSGVLSVHWEKLLAEAATAALFVEASVQVLRLEVRRYRKALIAIDDRVRACLNKPDQETIRTILDDLHRWNSDWIGRQADAAMHLVEKQESLGDMADTGAALRDILDEQRAQIETTCNNIGMLDFATEPGAGCTRLVREIARLIDSAHGLRDRMLDTITVIARHEGKLASLDPSMCVDVSTELHNRAGLECELFRWRRDDPERLRQLCLAVFDVDRFRPVNEQHGAIAGDRLLQGMGLLMASLNRKERGYDLVARTEGQQFVCLYGDTGARNAICAVERVRQTLEAARFEYQGRTFELTVSVGLTEMTRGDDVATVFRRLQKSVRTAKAAGRNCTVLDDGQGCETVESPRYDVPGRLVRIEA